MFWVYFGCVAFLLAAFGLYLHALHATLSDDEK